MQKFDRALMAKHNLKVVPIFAKADYRDVFGKLVKKGQLMGLTLSASCNRRKINSDSATWGKEK